MATKYDEKIPFEKNGLYFYGLLKRGAQPTLPLIVLLHGGGATPAFFDNSVVSVVQELNNLGHDVLNISRPGYGGTPIPSTKTPLRDSIPAFIGFIEKVYSDSLGHSGQRPGIILIGHSIGGSLALSIAFEAKNRLPTLGVSVMGSLPSLKPLGLFPGLDSEIGGPRYVTEPTAENIRRFMGEVEWLQDGALTESVIAAVFEPAPKSELSEYLALENNTWLLNEVFPGVNVPVQFLAAEVDIAWENEQEGIPIFQDLVKRFVNASAVDAAILPRGGHNYEFSSNVGALLKRRSNFIQKLMAAR
ncbi:alpha/beta fold hydrolase [Aspergillus undulatus]|uniref:alpha/beta fold hydrolase n=1 Tax=Aspergillus undulatus TaxID=1810928 RepID=UPI003CCD9CF9